MRSYHTAYIPTAETLMEAWMEQQCAALAKTPTLNTVAVAIKPYLSIFQYGVFVMLDIPPINY